jgi:tRNA threonylcarbamoyladenosine biosynthesis protein TsaB
MSIVLAADTSTAICSVALCKDHDILAETVLLGDRLHAERMIATVDWVLAQAGITPDLIDLLAIAQGPGSFTGLRIGAAVFKGLALAWARPLAGVSTLESLAYLAPIPGMPVCPLLDARMDEVYGATFVSEDGVPRRTSPDQVLPPAVFAAGLKDAVYFLGDGARRYEAVLRAALPLAHFAPPVLSQPRASAVGMAGLAHWRAGLPVDAAQVAPVYLRKSQAEMNALAGAVQKTS